ncbi:MAG TPA: class I SAM-dependent methyltransferase [Burkholderiales bacterium]|jgi:SAM-dependent methyltransferase|nr:class I SAM-dependent methyltransferase [Burkholderiales bacterium]
MHAVPALRHALAFVLAASCTLAAAQAQKAPTAYEPAVGQEGKDVVWVPTSDALVNKMLDMAKVTPRDFVMDLGSGDGRTVIAAAKRGARAMGIEYNPDMVALSQKNAEKAGVSKSATFMKADLFQTDFSKATVITMFLLPEINLKLRPKILALKPGTRVVSNSFTMGEWQADESATLGDETGCSSWCTALLWIVPARAAGRYTIPDGELVLQQEFQMLSGTLRATGGPVAVDGRVRGEEVSFKAGGKQYRGRITNGKLELK